MASPSCSGSVVAVPDSRRTDLVLLLVAIVWGSSYFAAKAATGAVPVLAVLFARYALSALAALAVIAVIAARSARTANCSSACRLMMSTGSSG